VAAADEGATPGPAPEASSSEEEIELPAAVLAEIDADVARYRERQIRKAKSKVRRPRKAPREPRPSKPNAVDEAAVRGIMPDKPIITSAANQHYQKRFDRLAALAAAGDWDPVRTTQVNGDNTYARMLKSYRARLLLAHAFSAATAETAP